MTDIVERLQAVVDHWQVVDASKLCAEAKREIERLRQEKQGLHGVMEKMAKDSNNLAREIERLRAALTAERERCALKAYREIIAAVDDVRLANTIRDAIREGEL